MPLHDMQVQYPKTGEGNCLLLQCDKKEKQNFSVQAQFLLLFVCQTKSYTLLMLTELCERVNKGASDFKDF